MKIIIEFQQIGKYVMNETHENDKNILKSVDSLAKRIIETIKKFLTLTRIKAKITYKIEHGR